MGTVGEVFLLLSLLSFLPLVGSDPVVKAIAAPYFFPENLNYAWHPIDVTSLTCPPQRSIPEQDKGIPVIFETIHPSSLERALVNGYSCYTSTMAVKCSVNFVGWKTLSHQITNKEPSSTTCWEAIKRQEDGAQSPPPTFPAPNCAWWSENWAELDYTLVLKHPARQDPYTETLYDPLFPGGSCNKAECPLIHDGGIWIQTEPLASICKHWEVLQGLTYTGPEIGRILFSPEGPPKYLDHSCRMTFCGRRGYRLQDGEFLVFSSPPAWGVPPVCPAGTLVRAHTPEEEIRWNEISKMEEADRLMCISRLSVAYATGKVSLELLGSLVPSHGGPGTAYRINNGTLEAAHVKYVPLINSSNEEGNLIGVGPNGTPILWEYWVLSGSRMIGPNGVYKSKGRIIVPNFERRKLTYDLTIHVFEDLKEIPHPSLVIRSNHTDLLRKVSHNQGVEGDHWASIRLWFSSLWGSFIWTCGLALIGLILICCICRRVRCCCRGCGRPQSKEAGGWESIEMNDL
uniref:Glycoprotein n=1 Tax=Bole Tick Virus 2 TaxID=1608041 RepID=A0A482M0J9_9RHAB|nr:glycoprotein [Bole Tick Virus 2]